MTSDEVIQKIDLDNGIGFYRNVSVKGYRFFKDGSFIIFKFHNIEGIQIVNISYMHVKNKKSFMTIMSYACNFWMGNGVKFVYYKQKYRKQNSPVEYLKELGFRLQEVADMKYPYKFDCVLDGTRCHCSTYEMYK